MMTLLRICAVLLALVLWYGSSAAATFYSRQNGSWSNLNSWSTTGHAGAPAVVLPMPGDDVFINNSHSITLNINAQIRHLVIQQGTLLYDNVAVRNLTIDGDLNIGISGTLTVQTVGLGLANTLNLRGNIVNNGTWTMRPVANTSNFRVTTHFIGTGTQTITGSPILTRLYRVVMDKGAPNIVLDVGVSIGISSVNVGVDAIVFQTGGGGTWRQSAGILTFDDGASVSSSQILESQGAIHITGSAALLFGQNGAGASFVLQGGELLFNTTSMVISKIGSATGNRLEYQGSVDISRFTMHNGLLSIAGRLSRSGANDVLNYTQTGGTVYLGEIGHSSASRGTFDLARPASTFTMSGGSLIFRGNNNSAIGGGRPADLFLGGTVLVSGGTIQFGDAPTPPNEIFDYNIPSNAVLNNVVVGNATTRLSPFSALQTLRLAGNLEITGAFNASVTTDGSTPASGSTVVFQGNNALDQTVSGTGSIIFHHCTMNRQGAGNGVVAVNRTVTLSGTLDFSTFTNPQIISLGSGADLTIGNSSPSAILNAGANHYIRTSGESGRLWRTLVSSGTYEFPIGSISLIVPLNETYTPMSFVSGLTSSGQLGARVAPGKHLVKIGAHARMPTAWDNYLRKVWSLQSLGLTGSGQLTFTYPDDIAGTLDILQVARYTPDETSPGGAWGYFPSGFISGTTSSIKAPGTFMPTALTAAEISGDWTLAEPLRRIFYSRASGLWSLADTWSYSSHRGTPVTTGNYPSKTNDSVVIGGGSNGLNNHVVVLDRAITIAGLTLGTGTYNTGTLELPDELALRGEHFMMGDRSQLKIGSANGLSKLPEASGNIQTTVSRVFPANACYEYIGKSTQVYGSGLPQTLRSLWISKPFGVSLLAQHHLGIWQDIHIFSGNLELDTYSAHNVTTSTLEAELRILRLNAGAGLKIGGIHSMTGATIGLVKNYTVYELDSLSMVEYYGAMQGIEPAPNGFVGYGNLTLSGAGDKSITQNVVVRNNVYNRQESRLITRQPGGVLRVKGNFYNNAVVQNEGTLEIGQSK